MSLSTLPDDVVYQLKQIHASGDRTALRQYIKALRSQQWSLRAIGEPLGVSKSTVQFWETTGDTKTDENLAVPVSPKAIETAGVKTVRWRSRILEADVEPMKRWALQARKVRSQTPDDSPLRDAASALDSTIYRYLERMVAVTEIAQTIGVTHRAVKARMERYSDPYK